MSKTQLSRPTTRTTQTNISESVTESHQMSQNEIHKPEATDKRHKINYCTHLGIMIRWAAEPGQTAHDSVCGWSAC